MAERVLTDPAGAFSLDLEDLELWAGAPDIDGVAFRRLVHEVLADLGLLGVIESITVSGPCRGRAELYRASKSDRWDSPDVCLDLYPDRYLDRNLLYHEFGHEADRRDPAFKYSHDREEQLDLIRGAGSNAYNLAWNISLDSRLQPRALSYEQRILEYRRLSVGPDAWFHELWLAPPVTHAAVIELAFRFQRRCDDEALL